MYPAEQQQVLSIVFDVTSALSLAGCVFIVLVYTCFRELRVFPFRLVLHMSVGDGLRCVGFLMQHTGTALCEVRAMFVEVGFLCSVLWNGVIARTLYLSVVKSVRNIEDLEFRYTAVVYVVAGVLSSLPWTTANYGDSEGWCWISADDTRYTTGHIWRGVCFFAPLLLVTVNNLYSYAQIIRTLRTGFAPSIEISTLIRKLRYYPLVMIVCYLTTAVKRVYDLAAPESPDFVLAVLAAVMLGMIGLADAVIYGFTRNVREAIRQKFCPHTDTMGESASSSFSMNSY